MLDRLAKIEKRYEELESLLARQEIINDRSLYNKYAKELADLKEKVDLFREYKKVEKELEELAGLLKQGHDSDFLELARKELEDLKAKKSALEEALKNSLCPQDKDLNRDVIVEIRQGTGGDEAGLFAADLYRMYLQYAQQKGWEVEVLSSSPSELGGFKEIIFAVKGKDAYKRLRFESGVHRVQRVPVTEAQGRIHTSTATVAVLLEPQEVDLVIEPKDLRIDTYRSSGPGGQHMQKTDSAVRITHIPTGIVVSCQDERSQIKNKSKAMRILRAKLLDLKEEQERRKITQERRLQIGSGERSEKIRTYNFPDRRITDHRIGFTTHRLEEVLDGDLDELSDALLSAQEKMNQERKDE